MWDDPPVLLTFIFGVSLHSFENAVWKAEESTTKERYVQPTQLTTQRNCRTINCIHILPFYMGISPFRSTAPRGLWYIIENGNADEWTIGNRFLCWKPMLGEEEAPPVKWMGSESEWYAKATKQEHSQIINASRLWSSHRYTLGTNILVRNK